jgi:hypothetical protein
MSPNILLLATLGSSFLELVAVMVVDAVAIEEVVGEDDPSLLLTSAEVEGAGRDFRQDDFEIFDGAEPVVFPLLNAG